MEWATLYSITPPHELNFLEHGRVGVAVRQNDGLQIVIVNGNIGLEADENEAARILHEILHPVEDCLALGIILFDNALLVEFLELLASATIDYGYPEPKIESKFAIGATPVFGDVSVDFNLARRIKFDDPSADRWLPYVTGTYTFNDNFNASLGVGYYAYDDSATEDFWELYIGSTLTLDSGAYMTTEFY